MLDLISEAKNYGAADVLSRILCVLRQSGYDEENLDWAALASFDQLHVGGVAATADLAAKLCIKAGSTLLDVGCGFGGAARYLSAVHGCFVTGIDLNQSFINLAQTLTQRTNLTHQVRFVAGDAGQLPFPPESFDLAWMQHVVMKIPDPAKLYKGIQKVLRIGGRLALYEQVAGERSPVLFPLPWARDSAESFLVSTKDLKKKLELCGFEILHWQDVTDIGIQWGEDRDAALDHQPNLNVRASSDGSLSPMVANLGQNLRERRIRLIQAIVERSNRS